MIPGIIAGGMQQGGGIITYWNPLDKHAFITLSDSDKVAANTSGIWASVRSTLARSTGKYYVEVVYVSGLDWAVVLGIANASANLSQYIGENTNSWGLQCNQGAVSALYHSGAIIGNTNIINAGDFVRMAIDITLGRLWIGSSANWVGGGNPSTNTSPSVTFTPGMSTYIGAGLYLSLIHI